MFLVSLVLFSLILQLLHKDITMLSRRIFYQETILCDRCRTVFCILLSSVCCDSCLWRWFSARTVPGNYYIHCQIWCLDIYIYIYMRYVYIYLCLHVYMILSKVVTGNALTYLCHIYIHVYWNIQAMAGTVWSWMRWQQRYVKLMTSSDIHVQYDNNRRNNNNSPGLWLTQMLWSRPEIGAVCLFVCVLVCFLGCFLLLTLVDIPVMLDVCMFLTLVDVHVWLAKC